MLTATERGVVGSRRLGDREASIAAVLLSLAAIWLYLQNNNFVLGVHPDEMKKVTFILTGEQDFMHPILMLQVSRFVNLFAGATDPQQVAEMGRSISAVFGGLFVCASFLLARLALSAPLALLAAAIVAIAPLTAIHAQVLKEDVYCAPFVALALVALVRHMSLATRASAAAVGVCVGLAVSAKLISLLLIPVIVLSGFLGHVNARRAYLVNLFAVALPLAIFLVIVVNFPAFLEPAVLAKGMGYEFSHATTGHFDKSMSALDTWFSHYFRVGLMRGLGPPIAFAALLGFFWTTWRWRALGNELRVPIVFAACWYIAHELSPMKPGVSRYMLPLGPPLVILAIVAIGEMARILPRRESSAFTLAMIFLAAWPATRTVAALAVPDATQVARRFADELAVPVFVDRGLCHPRPNKDGLIEAATRHGPQALDMLKADWDYVATRNVKGQRYVANIENANAIEALFGKLYREGYIEVRHVLGPYEFRQRTIRIVALAGDAHKLKALADQSPAPAFLQVTYVPAVTELGSAFSGSSKLSTW